MSEPNLLAMNEAVDRLERYLPALHDALVDAWTTWQQHTAPTFASSRRSRANVVHDIIVANLRTNVPEAIEQNLRGMVTFLFDDQIAIRVKKLDDELAPKNILTRQVIQYRRQEDIEGLPSAHHLELGYVLDALQSRIVSTHLICPSGKKSHAWTLDLSEYIKSKRMVGAPGLVIPLLPMPEVIEATPVKFRRKSTGAEERHENSND